MGLDFLFQRKHTNNQYIPSVLEFVGIAMSFRMTISLIFTPCLASSLKGNGVVFCCFVAKIFKNQHVKYID